MGSFIELDLGSLSISTINMESTTSGEEWEIWGSNTAAVAGHALGIPSSTATGVLTGYSEGNQNVSSLSNDRYIFITVAGPWYGNVLLGGATAVTTPEPGTASLLGLALVGSGLLFRRRSTKKAQQS